MTDDQAVPPPDVAAITGMLARRYSAQPTPRDLDVADIAAAAERARIRAVAEEHDECCDVKWLLDLLDGGDPGGQP